MANLIRNRIIVDILKSFDREKIDFFLVKGIALGPPVYETSELRLMGNIDLLVGRRDLDEACSILSELEFMQEDDHDIPDDE